MLQIKSIPTEIIFGAKRKLGLLSESITVPGQALFFLLRKPTTDYQFISGLYNIK